MRSIDPTSQMAAVQTGCDQEARQCQGTGTPPGRQTRVATVIHWPELDFPVEISWLLRVGSLLRLE